MLNVFTRPTGKLTIVDILFLETTVSKLSKYIQNSVFSEIKNTELRG